MFKRIIDIFGAFLGIVFLFPPFLMLWILSKMSRFHSSFNSVRKVGKNERVFKLYRYKVVLTDSHDEPSTFARQVESLLDLFMYFKVDKYPILFNVLKGDLSLVGPKPEKPEFLEYYTTDQKVVFSVRPGIWRPDGYINDMEEDESLRNSVNWREDYVRFILPAKIREEIEYVQNKQFGKDFSVFWQSTKMKIHRAVYQLMRGEVKGHNLVMPLDVVVLSLSYLIAYELRFEWVIPEHEWELFLRGLPIVVGLRIASFYYFGIYKNLWKYVNVRDLMSIITACSTSSVLIIAVFALLGISHHSRSVFLIDWVLSITMIGGTRLLFRFFDETFKVPLHRRSNVLILGTGEVGVMVSKMLDINGRDKYDLIGFVSDNPNMHGRTVQGFKVLGSIEDIPRLTSKFNVDEVLIAEPELSSADMKRIIRLCKDANLRHRIVPAVNDLLNGSVHLSKFREVEISDLFGRNPVELDLSAIKFHLNARGVLVTGAGGSIGSELCRQISEFQPEFLLLLDKNENYLHEIQTELASQFPQLRLYSALGSITNRNKLRRIFDQYHPEIIFHAAAHKHVPLSENNTEEAIWNNVFGTRYLADFAHEFSVKDFVMVSTDKAVNPTSVMGVTKRIAELYIQALGRESRTKFVTVRFGNVLNSNGSVIPIFRKQIEKGGPVTITHPDVERFFMSISEAVQLILQAFTMGKSGEIFILEMGKSIRIMEMAIELITQAGYKPFDDIPIEVVGLRPGEKLYEELISIHEESISTSHASIKTLRSNHVYSLDEITRKIHELKDLDYSQQQEAVAKKLKEIVPEYTFTPNEHKKQHTRSHKNGDSQDDQSYEKPKLRIPGMHNHS